MSASEVDKIFVIGTQHLDVAWLWTRVPHGEELMRMVFELAIDLSRRNPAAKFVMSRSTAWGFQVVENKFPALFEKVQQAVAHGTIEVCGGQWVEPDNFVPSGESHLRQCLYAQHYFLSRFGKMASVAWDPDVFGHGNTLPQIFRTCGLEGYYFHRRLPKDEAGRPIRQFIWESPDGSWVYCFAGGWIERPDEKSVRELLTSNDHHMPLEVAVAGRRSDRRMTIRESWLGLPAALKEEFGVDEARWSSASDVVEEMKTYHDRLPVLQGDLGGYMMTGTYTSDQITKRYNRKLENDLANAEFVNTLSLLCGGTYNAGLLGGAWRDLCLNQFHDIACGTSYRIVHEEGHRLFESIERRSTDALAMAHGDATSAIRTDSAPGVPFVVYNALSSPRTDSVIVTAPIDGPVRVVASDGRDVASQATGGPDSKRLIFAPESVPACGHDVYFLQSAREDTLVRDDELVLENQFVRVEFDLSYGSISSIYDKRLSMEFVQEETLANRIVTYVDKNEYPSSPESSWDPWYIAYTGESYDPHGAYTVTVTESGPVRKTILVERSYLVGPDRPLSVINQEISLYCNSPMIHIRMFGNWQAEQATVKAEFDLSFAAEQVVCDMPYGVIERPSVCSMKDIVGAEAMEDQVERGSERDDPDRPMQKWIDFSDGEKGIAFLNNGKYGYDSGERRIGLTLMRAPFIRKGEVAGRGPFEFSYAILPHAGTWCDAELPQLGYEFNRPLIALQAWRHGGGLEPRTSHFLLSDPAVLVTSVKKAERSAGVVVRLYESQGADRELTLTSHRAIDRARVTDGLEMGKGTGFVVSCSDHELTVRIGRFAILTLLLELQPEA